VKNIEIVVATQGMEVDEGIIFSADVLSITCSEFFFVVAPNVVNYTL
jgi:hypothetical protein